MFLGAENNNVGLKQENSTPHTQNAFAFKSESGSAGHCLGDGERTFLG